MSDDPEALCRAIYAETRCLYVDRVSPLGEADRGFRILYGPPVVEPPILFVGFQPGGHEAEPEQHDGWPAVCDYTVATWTLARRLREVFGADTLERCTGLNRIFFRSPSITAWRKVDVELRHDLEAFSLERAKRIVRTLRPRRIVVIGLGTLADLSPQRGRAGGREARPRAPRRALGRAGLWRGASQRRPGESGRPRSAAQLLRARGRWLRRAAAIGTACGMAPVEPQGRLTC